MATGILKYKQDDGSIVELTPAGFVTQTTYNAGQAAQDAKIAALKAITPDILPYLFDRVTISSFMYSATAISYAVAYLDLPWLHSQSHQLTAHLSGAAPFYVVNLRDGSVQSVTPDSITIYAVCSDSSPYHVNIQMQLPASITANTPYLVTATTSFISIE